MSAAHYCEASFTMMLNDFGSGAGLCGSCFSFFCTLSWMVLFLGTHFGDVIRRM